MTNLDPTQRVRAFYRRYAPRYDQQVAYYDRVLLGDGRAWACAQSRGAVLEVAIGTGRNLPLYRNATRVVALEPGPGMRARANHAGQAAQVPVEVVDGTAEHPPFPDAAFDAVVASLVLCTVPNLAQTLAEARRVLRPGGTLRFYEHVRADDPRLARWQDRLERPWGWLAGGCHPNRDTQAAIADAGFAIGPLEVFEPTPNSPITRPFIQGAATRPPGGRTR